MHVLTNQPRTGRIKATKNGPIFITMASFEHNLYNEEWTRSDKHHNSFLIPQDDVLDKVLANCVKQGLPDIAVSAAQGKYLKLLAQAIGAKRILEVGTLGGYSTIWMGRALPDDGELISLEANEKHVQVGTMFPPNLYLLTYSSVGFARKH